MHEERRAMSTTQERMTTTLSPAPQASKLAIGSWALYDLANTIYSMNITSLYFSLWVVNVMHAGDSAYAYSNGFSMAVIFCIAPLLGALTDQSPRRMPFLVVSTIICVACTAMLGTGGLSRSLVFFIIANIAYQAGLQFYDATLVDVSTEQNRGKIGGLGIGAGYIGSFLGVGMGAVILAGVDKLPPDVQSAKYAQVFKMTAILFLIFAIPCFIFVHDRVKPNRRFTFASVGAAMSQVAETIRTSGRYPGLGRFLIGRVFYTDAVNTVIAFMGIYVTNEVGFTTQQVQVVMLTAISCAALGAYAWGLVVDRIGPKRTLNIVLIMWMFVFAWAAIVGFMHLPQITFWPVAVFAGIGLGGTWVADRPFMLRLTPPARVGEFYGLYGMVGRFSAITGPFVWALVVDTLKLGRPTAIVTLLGGIIIAYFILRPVSDEPRAWSGADIELPVHVPTV
jgi:MFS transporter, UMF1 family